MDECMVSICCITYNHGKYIREALESFLCQQTNFRFEILIHDDASTDNTAEIIREYEKKYPDKIKAMYQKCNQKSKGFRVGDYLMSKAKGKYIALCEGDDYWTDNNKLQIQYNYMESNRKTSLYVHAGERVSIDKKLIKLVSPSNIDKIYTTEEVLLGGGGLFVTNSMFFRSELLNELPNFYKKCSVGDYPLVVYLSLKGEIYYSSKVMAAYRVGVEGSWTSEYEVKKELIIKHYYAMNNTLDQINKYTNNKYLSTINKLNEKRAYRLLIRIGKNYEWNSIFEDIYSQLSLLNKVKLKIELADSYKYFKNIKMKIYKFFVNKRRMEK